MSWRDYLKVEEVERLADLKGHIKAIHAEQRRIYDRCRKRAALAIEAQRAGTVKQGPVEDESAG